MRSKAYCINMIPMAWQRIARSHSKAYSAYMRDQVAFGLYLSQQHNDEPFFENPVHLDVTFFMPLHKLPKNKQDILYCITPPYLDNLYTFFVDSLKDIVIKNSHVICSMSLKKVYDKEPRTELVITEVI